MPGRSQVNFAFLQVGGDYAFINALKTAQAWTLVDNSGAPAPDSLNDNGYPISISNDGVNTVFFIPNQTNRPGNWVVKWIGEGTIFGGSGVTVSGSNSGVDGRWVITPNGTPDADTTQLRIVLGISAINVANPITNLAYIHADDEAAFGTLNADGSNSGDMFGVKFKERLREANFGVYRFLDWNNINGSTVTQWSERTPINYVMYGGYYAKSSIYAGVTTHSGDDYSVTLAGFLLADKVAVTVMFDATSTGYYGTLNVSGTGAIPILPYYGDTAEYNVRKPTADRYALLIYDADLNIWMKYGGDAEYFNATGFNGGVPIEHEVRLCNEMGAHPWFQVPHYSLDKRRDYATELATYVEANCGLIPRFEPSNEVWNSAAAFWQTRYAWAKGFIYWPATGTTDPHAWYGKVLSEMGQDISSVYANDRTKYQVICGNQTYAGTPVNERLDSTYYVADGGSAAKNWSTDIAIANYFSNTDQFYDPTAEGVIADSYAAADTAGKAVILAAYVADNTLAGLQTIYDTYYTWAQGRGQGMTCYEGGWSPDYGGTANQNALRKASKSEPSLDILVRTNLREFTEAGGEFPSRLALSGYNNAWSVLDPDIYAADLPQWTAYTKFKYMGYGVPGAIDRSAEYPGSVPSAPVIGTATGGNAQASVAFTEKLSEGITSYTVTSTPGSFTGVGSTSPIVVTGLSNGTEYTFKVKATNSHGTGSESSASNAVTPALPETVPDAPTIGTATREVQTATVTFTPPGSDGGSAITLYTVYSSVGGFSATGASSPITITGLAATTAYTFTVKATNAIGEGAASAASNSVTTTQAYFVKNGGSDVADGKSDANAWATIGKVNGATFAAGDGIYLKKASVWRDAGLVVPRSGTSGNSMIFSSYGSGANPIISGADVLTTWTNVSGTIYSKAGITTEPRIVHYNGVRLAQNAQLPVAQNVDLRNETFEGTGYSASGWSENGTPDEDAATTEVGSPADWGSQCLKISAADNTNVNSVNTLTLEEPITWTRFEFIVTSHGMLEMNDVVQLSKGWTNAFGLAWQLFVQRTQLGSLQFLFAVNRAGSAEYFTGLQACRMNTKYRIEVKFDFTNKVWAWRINGVDQPNNVDGSYPITSEGSGNASMAVGVKRITFGPTNGGATHRAVTLYYDQIGISKVGWVGQPAGALGLNEWYWAADTLYVNVGEDPDTHALEAGQRNYPLTVNGKDYVTISGVDTSVANHSAIYILDAVNLKVTAGDWNGGAFYGTDTPGAGTTSNPEISYIKAHGFGSSGINISADADYWDHLWIHHNECYDNGWQAIPSTVTTMQGNSSGIKVWGGKYIVAAGESDFVTIEWNHVHDNYDQWGALCGTGIWVDQWGTNAVVRYNTIHNNEGPGLVFENMDGGTGYHNLVYSNTMDGILVYRNATTQTIYNNVSYGNGYRGLACYGGSAGEQTMTGNLFKNNISSGNLINLSAKYGGENAGSGSGNVYTYNSFGVEAATFIEWGASVYKTTYADFDTAYGSASNSATTDPLLVSSSDFHLQSGSPCKDTGTDVSLTTDLDGVAIPQGANPAIGAYEVPA